MSNVLVMPGSAEWKELMGEAAAAQPTDDLSDLFPTADPGFRPFGRMIVVQLRSPKEKTSGGVFLAEETKANEQWNEMTGRVHAIGPLCFKKSDTLEPWPEGDWCKVGDLVRVKKWVGDRIEVPVPNEPGRRALFVTTEDYHLIGEVTTDPRQLKAWV